MVFIQQITGEKRAFAWYLRTHSNFLTEESLTNVECHNHLRTEFAVMSFQMEV